MDKLGIEPKLLLAQIINFLIIVFVLSKLLYKPILQMLEKRKKEIQAGLDLTEKLRQEEEKLKLKRERTNEEARKEAQRILEEAHEQAQQEGKEIIAAAHTQAEGLLVKAKEEVARIHGSLTDQIRKESVELSIAMAKKVLLRSLGNSEQHRIIEQQLKKLEKTDLS